MWMNEFEIDEAVQRWEDHPILGAATLTLSNLRDLTNRNSDGWAYWPKPARAADKLMELIEGEGDGRARFELRHDHERKDVTVEKLRAAYRPIKAFMTRNAAVLTRGDLSTVIAEPGANAAAERAERAGREGRERLVKIAASAIGMLINDEHVTDEQGEHLTAAATSLHAAFTELLAPT